LKRLTGGGLFWSVERAFERYVSDYGGGSDRTVFEETVISAALADLRACLGQPAIARKAGDLIDAIGQLRNADPHVPSDLRASSYTSRAVRDLASRILLTKPHYSIEVHTYSFEPEDMADMLASHGFSNTLASFEGTLCLNGSVPSVKPMYPSRLGVYEVMCRRGGIGRAPAKGSSDAA
jgi:hypothetical protein